MAWEGLKIHGVNTNTSKLRLFILYSLYAGINEIILTGYPTESSTFNKKKITLCKTEEATLSNQNYKPLLLPNPVKEDLSFIKINLNM